MNATINVDHSYKVDLISYAKSGSAQMSIWVSKNILNPFTLLVNTDDYNISSPGLRFHTGIFTSIHIYILFIEDDQNSKFPASF